MKGAINKFIIKYGISPETVNAYVHINAGNACVLVYNERNCCVGVIWEHSDSKNSKSIGQAEMRFFDKYRSMYGVWHKMFLNGQRLPYEYLCAEIEKTKEYIYLGKIRTK